MEKNSTKCYLCKRELSSDEIGLCKKVFGRGLKKFICIYCCADKLNVSAEFLLKKIEEFRAMGCTLFKSTKNND